MRSARPLRVLLLTSLFVVALGLLCALSFGLSGSAPALGMQMGQGVAMGTPQTPSQLPDRAAVTHEETKKCGTPTIIEILAIWETLTLEERTALRWVFFRPTDPNGGIDDKQHLLPSLYQTTHFVFHYTTGTDGGDAGDAPDLTDANTNGVPDYIESYASYFETSYTKEVTERGFNPPPNDAGQPPNDARNRNPNGKYDVFVYAFAFYGYADPEDWPTTPSRSYIGVNKDYDWAPPNDDPEGDAKGAMKVTAAHEFHHAVQFTYDVQEESWWMETTSTYMEDEVYPAANDNYNYLPPWFEWSDGLGLTTSDGLHEYGNFIWAKRLSEDFSDAIVKEIWIEDQTSNGLAAIDNVLRTHGSNLIDEFNQFTRSNFFLEQLYTDGAGYRTAVAAPKTTFTGVWLEFQYDFGTHGLPFTIDASNVNWDTWMDTWAADYATLTLDDSVQRYRISFDGLDNTVGYQVTLWTRKGGVFKEYRFALDANKDGSVDLRYDAYDAAVIIIGRAGGSSNPLWQITIAAAPAPVGGLAQLPDVSGSSAPPYAAIAGAVAAAVVVLTAGACYARRRWLG
ncbi:MAG: hypothetical protein MUP14_05110 [Dehalococcoidia bacterium]|nr:hypothetical protein [Dehalococcoidia bacterium]